MSRSLRVQLHADDPLRRRSLAAMLRASGHIVVEETPDVVLCDLTRDMPRPGEAEAPVVVLTDRLLGRETPAGALPRQVSAAQLDAALQAAAVGLLVRAPGAAPSDGFRPVSDDAPPLLTPREAQILSLVGEGMSNKAVARRLGISAHTVKFHVEAVFAKLGAHSRADAVARGLRRRLIEV